jgi:hypothetical protein
VLSGFLPPIESNTSTTFRALDHVQRETHYLIGWFLSTRDRTSYLQSNHALFRISS